MNAQRLVVGFVCLVVLAYRLSADVSLSLDILDASDPGGPSPAGLLVVDAAVDVSADRFLAAAGIVARSQNGASFVYSSSDPNTPFLPPGAGQRFVTFGSAPYGRDDAARFAPAGTPEQPTIVVGTAWSGGVPQGYFRSSIVNTVWFSAPWSDHLLGRDGYVLRLVLDISGVALPGADDIANYRIFRIGDEPPGYSPVLLSEYPGEPGGIELQTGFDFEVARIDWGVYVPEPSGWLVLMLVSCCRRFRCRCP